MRRKNMWLGLLAGAAAVSAVPANAGVTFNFNDLGGTASGSEARAGFEIAASYWSSVLTDDVQVNLSIGFQALAPGVLGSAGSTGRGLLLQDTAIALINDTSSALDGQAVSSLVAELVPSTNPDYAGLLGVNMNVNNFVDPATMSGYTDTSTRFDTDGSGNNVALDVNSATAKALGFTGTDIFGNQIEGVTDATIRFSSNFDFDFNPTDGIAPGHYDFIGVAIHEIGHALGFVSGVDLYDIVSRPGSPDYGAPFPPGVTYADLLEGGAFGPDPNLEDFAIGSTLDLFRYGADGNLDWSTQGTQYFSIDGGATQLFGDSRVSTGRFNGDGNQASHWIDNEYAASSGGCSTVVTAPIGIMNPTSGRCEEGAITALDLAAFDAMGWDVDFDVLANAGYSFSTGDAYNQYITSVPEPATWAQMILGFGLIGGAIRRLQVRKVTVAAA